MPAYFESRPYDVSADGSVVVGISGYEAFRWTSSSGIVGLGYLNGNGAYSVGRGVSADGSIVVGNSSSNSPSGSEAFYWTAPSTMVGLGENSSFAFGTSRDGSVTVGDSISGNHNRATIWSNNTVLTLNDLTGSVNGYSTAFGVSADGNTVVGKATNGTSTEAFRWTSAGGMVGLGILPGKNSSEANSSSADGSVIVGNSNILGSTSLAFRWTSSGGIESLGVLSGATRSVANDVSGDGNLIVGASGGAYVWNAGFGMRSLYAYAASAGVNLDGWTSFTLAQAISEDGTTIVGYGQRNGVLNGFVLRDENRFGLGAAVPEPSTLFLVASLALSSPFALRKIGNS